MSDHHGLSAECRLQRVMAVLDDESMLDGLDADEHEALQLKIEEALQ
jgi:hypothetical protein